MQPLTELQERLLAEIRNNNTLTNAQYAKLIGSSEGSTQDMIAKLIKRGYIVKPTTRPGQKRPPIQLADSSHVRDNRTTESPKDCTINNTINSTIKDTKTLIIEDIEKRKVNAKVRELEAKYNHLLAEYEDSEKRFDTLLNIKEQVKIINIEPILSQSKSEAIPIIQLSDWHFEEKVDPLVINGLNEYNLDIAAYRWNKCIQNSLKLVHKERQSSDIEQVVLWLGGDFISGYLHEELEEDNYLSPTQATRFAKEKIITAIKFYLEHGKFKRITIPCNFGNHGRTGKKPRVSTGYKNTYEWMMYNDIADYFSGEKRVQFNIPNGLFAYLNVFEKKCRFWHGDSIKYGGGIGGLTVPLIKAIHKYDEQTKADYNFMGHYHQLWQATKNCIVNGSGIGFSPYAQRIGASPEEPKQAFSLIDVKYGMTTKMEIYCK